MTKHCEIDIGCDNPDCETCNPICEFCLNDGYTIIPAYQSAGKIIDEERVPCVLCNNDLD